MLLIFHSGRDHCSTLRSFARLLLWFCFFFRKTKLYRPERRFLVFQGATDCEVQRNLVQKVLRWRHRLCNVHREIWKNLHRNTCMVKLKCPVVLREWSSRREWTPKLCCQSTVVAVKFWMKLFLCHSSCGYLFPFRLFSRKQHGNNDGKNSIFGKFPLSDLKSQHDNLPKNGNEFNFPWSWIEFWTSKCFRITHSQDSFGFVWLFILMWCAPMCGNMFL